MDIRGITQGDFPPYTKNNLALLKVLHLILNYSYILSFQSKKVVRYKDNYIDEVGEIWHFYEH